MKNINRRKALQVTAAIGALAMAPGLAQAEVTFSDRPIRLLVGFQAGTSTDLLARVVAENLRASLGTTVVVENMPGAGQVVAIQELQKSDPDGYTLLLTTGSALAQGPSVRKDLRYDPRVDFAPISVLGTNSGVIFARSDLPANALSELIDLAKANPDTLSYGSSGIGSASHLQVEYLAKVTGIELVHVPYKSDSDAAVDTSTGILDLGILNLRSILPFYESKSLKPLAHIATARAAQIPDMPTVEETGVTGLGSMVPFSFFGIVGPKALPDEIVLKLRQEIAALSQKPEYVAQLRENLFIDPEGAAETDLAGLIETELAKWSSLGITVE